MGEEKEIIKFIFEQNARLSCIERFNTTPRLAPENVAVHSHSVTFVTMIVGNYLRRKGVELDMERMMCMASIHDIEEIISGDIIKLLKSGEFKKELDKLNTMNMRFLTDVLGGEGKIYFDLWCEAKKKETLEAKIVDFVDMVACVIYSLKEIRLGNEYFKEILEYAVETSLKFSDKIPEIEDFVKELANYALNYLAAVRVNQK